MSSSKRSTVVVPTIPLSDGNRMPRIGLGTYLAKKGECETAVQLAIDAGYRHLDTAFVYGNETEVGNAVRAKIAAGVVRRDEMFVVTKLGNHHHAVEQVRPACERSVQQLGLGPIDLYLMHTPMGHQPEDTDYVDTWRAMEPLVRDGLVRSLGVSNFNSEQLRRLCEAATIRPVTNQVECSPNLQQRKLRAVHDEYGIVLTAYGPLTRPHRTAEGQQTALTDPTVKALALKYGKTEAQICLNYLVGRLGSFRMSFFCWSFPIGFVRMQCTDCPGHRSDPEVEQCRPSGREYRCFRFHTERGGAAAAGEAGLQSAHVSIPAGCRSQVLPVQH